MKQTAWVKKVDSTPTQNSENLVESGGVYSELAGKQNTLTFDTTPTSNSTKPVTSGGVYTEAGNLAAGMAILANNNTHAAIASDQYVYVRGHSTLTEGLYKATAAIAANGTLSTSNLTAVSNGGLNALNSNIEAANPFNIGTVITDNDSLDSYTTPGRYYKGNSSTITGKPSDVLGMLGIDLYVYPRSATTRIWQLLFVYESDNSRIYYRPQTSASTWADWRMITNTNVESSEQKVDYITVGIPQGSQTTYTFAAPCAFTLQTVKLNATSTTPNGFYIGQAHNAGSILAVQESSVVTVSISGKVLTLEGSSTNLRGIITIYNY